MERSSSQLPVEPYQSRNESRLEPHRAFVAELRRQGWPFHAMAERLQKECGVSISVSAIHAFCKKRKIKKGIGETVSQPATSTSQAATTKNVADSLKPATSPRKKKRFSYGEEDEKSPLQTVRT